MYEELIGVACKDAKVCEHVSVCVCDFDESHPASRQRAGTCTRNRLVWPAKTLRCRERNLCVWCVCVCVCVMFV